MKVKSQRIVRSVAHTTKFTNKRKRELLAEFVRDYRYAVHLYVDALWKPHLEWDATKPDVNGVTRHYVLDVEHGHYDVPNMLSNVEMEKTMDCKIRNVALSARAKACALSQALGMCKAAIEKARRYQYVISRKSGGRMTTFQVRKMQQKKPRKPHCDNVKAELRSLCASIIDNSNTSSKFDKYIRLSSLGKKYGNIVIPLNNTRCDRKFVELGFLRLAGVLVSEANVDIRYVREQKEREEGETLGCDQGMKDTLTLSNGLTTPRVDAQGKTVDMLYHKLARKRKGSKAFRKAETELTNFVNWQVKQTVQSLGGVKCINLEKVYNIRFRRSSSRLMTHWSNPRIVDALKANCEISGVHVHEEPSTYMSQRCSVCGLVRKASRKGKTYKCPHCGHEMDADLNAAVNHTVGLHPIDWRFRKLNLNRGRGFYWMPDGLYSVSDGGEPGVHLDPTSGMPMEEIS